jgi:hypothetical protein
MILSSTEILGGIIYDSKPRNLSKSCLSLLGGYDIKDGEGNELNHPSYRSEFIFEFSEYIHQTKYQSKDLENFELFQVETHLT